MPRKPKLEKQSVTVVIGGTPYAVILHPPGGPRKSWYVYWNGLVSSKSTGQYNLNDALAAVEAMVSDWLVGRDGRRPLLGDAVMSDEEFEQLQRAHFAKKKDPAAQARAAKSLKDCLEAIRAFRDIVRVEPISFTQPVALVRPDICAAFQREALKRPKNWRQQHPNSKKEVACVSPNTVLKWSRELQAAFERASRNAGKKCVRGVVDERKLLDENPWRQFTWAVEEVKKPIRQLDGSELLSFLDYSQAKWPGVTVAQAFAKVSLWSWGRREEVASLEWSSLRTVGNEYHFSVVGKWGVEKWFRIPEGLYQELLALKPASPYVFAIHNAQLRQFHERAGNTGLVKRVGAEFSPASLAQWFYKRVVEWSESLPNGRATAHDFRKTTMQYARRGEDINREVAGDVRVSPSVMMTHYVKETDEELRQKSNRTFQRILASLAPEVASRYGHIESAGRQLEEKLKAALAAEDWPLVARLSSELAKRQQSAAG